MKSISNFAVLNHRVELAHIHYLQVVHYLHLDHFKTYRLQKHVKVNDKYQLFQTNVSIQQTWFKLPRYFLKLTLHREVNNMLSVKYVAKF